jgi:hypothetical protein
VHRPRGGRGSRPALCTQADMRVPSPAALLRFRLSARLPRSGCPSTSPPAAPVSAASWTRRATRTTCVPAAAAARASRSRAARQFRILLARRDGRRTASELTPRRARAPPAASCPATPRWSCRCGCFRSCTSATWSSPKCQSILASGAPPRCCCPPPAPPALRAAHARTRGWWCVVLRACSMRAVSRRRGASGGRMRHKRRRRQPRLSLTRSRAFAPLPLQHARRPGCRAGGRTAA